MKTSLNRRIPSQPLSSPKNCALRSRRSDDLIIHGGIAIGGGGTAAGILVLLSASVEVVCHFGIEFLGGLLGGAGVARLLASTAGAGASALRGSLLLLVGCRLGLGLRLGDALGQSLRWGSHLGRLGTTNHDLDLGCVS